MQAAGTPPPWPGDKVAAHVPQGKIARRSDFVFGHNKVHRTGPGRPVLISSFHPSQQNTSTGKLTDAMLRAVFLSARRILDRERG